MGAFAGGCSVSGRVWIVAAVAACGCGSLRTAPTDRCAAERATVARYDEQLTAARVASSLGNPRAAEQVAAANGCVDRCEADGGTSCVMRCRSLFDAIGGPDGPDQAELERRLTRASHALEHCERNRR